MNLSTQLLLQLEQMNDKLYEGTLENDDNLKEIIYQCQRLIDITD